ncbi:Uncharacterized protein HA466_0123510 [Hirschfeldia incana]|nr:Uncharacterized protein HA466_0123510 [Hirschfeldia incana]
MSARYWCHMCSQTVNPVTDAEIKCPFCQNGFVEEMSGELSDDGSSSSMREEVQDSEIDFGTEGALADLALWGPIVLGMMSNPRIRTTLIRRTELGLDNDEVAPAPALSAAANVDGNESNVDDTHHRRHHHNRRRHHRRMHHDSIIRRRRRSPAEISQLLQDLNEAINTDEVRTGLAHLLEHLAGDNAPIRHGTLPACKEAVENLPTVKICEPLQCSVCLDDFEKGSVAKEMPCKHKFHVGCIVPWLELHGSCPVCRYELPPDGVVKTDLVSPGTTSVGINTSNENVEEGARNTSWSERWFSLVPWPFSGLFSSSSSSGSASSGPSQLNENSSSA